jgi:hypothetical protein
MSNLDRWHRDQQIQQLQNQSRYKPEPFKPAPKPDMRDRLRPLVWAALIGVTCLLWFAVVMPGLMIWRMWS